MNIQQAIKTLMAKQNLSKQQMHSIMLSIMTGKASDAQISGFLVALAIKGETMGEIVAAAKVMRSLVTKVHIHKPTHLIDTCGTGGDSLGLFNISTACAFVAAVAGAQVAKHGNRSISSKSGSADVLESAGVNLNIDKDKIATCIENIGFGFMFAPVHHTAMKHVIKARRELAVRTIFNVLGPLTNPAQAPNQIIGVYDKSLVDIIVKVLKDLGSEHVMVVHSQDGLDEISIAADTFVAELKDNKITNYTISPSDFELALGDLADIKVDNAQESLLLIRRALSGENGTAKDIVALNAGAAIYVAGLSNSMQTGVDEAIRILNSGVANDKFDAFIKASNS